MSKVRSVGRSRSGEILFCKKSGEYFLYGIYEKVVSGAWIEKEEILPMEYEDAEEWVRNNICDRDFNAEFMINSAGKVFLHAQISKTALNIAKRNVAREKISLTAYIEQLILEQE